MGSGNSAPQRIRLSTRMNKPRLLASSAAFGVKQASAIVFPTNVSSPPSCGRVQERTRKVIRREPPASAGRHTVCAASLWFPFISHFMNPFEHISSISLHTASLHTQPSSSCLPVGAFLTLFKRCSDTQRKPCTHARAQEQTVQHMLLLLAFVL